MKRQYDAEFIKSYYDEYGKREWDRWDVSVVEEVKFAVHLHYLQTRLKSQDRILEIGAGAGRFTKELAQITN
ncbi:MAG: class I SAM-dependent methyltransferase, partial [Rhodothermales bacterium]